MPADSYRLAILYNPKELQPPSNLQFLQKLKRIGKTLNVDVQLLTQSELKSLPYFNGLFIRTETRFQHYSYRWAELAEGLGLTVIDTAHGIRLGCNKELQFELFQKYDVPIPKTHIIFEFDDVIDSIQQLDMCYPLIIKVPEGAWSSGVFKVLNKKECIKTCLKLIKENFSLILQEFVYTKFDWRIGIINHEIIYACKYYMAPDHWQIVKHDRGKVIEGNFATVSLEKIPHEVKAVVNKINQFLDNSLYGIDLKATDKGVLAIEINDNPNIYAGVEDKQQPELYEKILKTFVPNLIKNTIKKRQLSEA